MIESGRIESSLPELDRANDPQGGAAAWALLAVSMVLIACVLLTVIWAASP